jgi:hypothetical protein
MSRPSLGNGKSRRLDPSAPTPRPVSVQRAWIDDYANAGEVELLLLDGFDEAILGIAERFDGTAGITPFVLYDRERCIELLIDQGCSLDEAEEYFEFNVAGAYVGPHTPGFLMRPPQ